MTLPNTFVNGTLADADEVNENFVYLDGFLQAVTNTDMDVTRTASTDGTTSTPFEWNAVSPTNNSYAVLSLSGVSSSAVVEGPSGSASSTVKCKIEIKEVGDAYSTLVNDVGISSDGEGGSNYNNGSQSSASTIVLPITLTAGHKANGFQIKVTFSVTTNNGASGYSISGSWVNIGSFLELK